MDVIQRRIIKLLRIELNILYETIRLLSDEVYTYTPHIPQYYITVDTKTALISSYPD